MAVQYSFDPWSRKMDGNMAPAVVPNPKKRYYPGSLAELLEVVREVGNGGDDNPQIRACPALQGLTVGGVRFWLNVTRIDPSFLIISRKSL